MIKSSFIFLDGIAEAKEKMLFSIGIRTWNDFLEKEHIPMISSHRKHYYNRKIQEAKHNLIDNNAEYFAFNFP